MKKMSKFKRKKIVRDLKKSKIGSKLRGKYYKAKYYHNITLKYQLVIQTIAVTSMILYIIGKFMGKW